MQNNKEEKKPCLNNMSDNEKQFYLQCAIAAMQGIQESGLKLVSGASELFAKETAARAFDMADAMLGEYYKHTNIIAKTKPFKNNKEWLEKRQLKLDLK